VVAVAISPVTVIVLLVLVVSVTGGSIVADFLLHAAEKRATASAKNNLVFS
jgi:hypothetical protein